VKILVVARGGVRDPRSGTRLFQHLPALSRAGHLIQVIPTGWPRPLAMLTGPRQALALVEDGALPMVLQRLLPERRLFFGARPSAPCPPGTGRVYEEGDSDDPRQILMVPTREPRQEARVAQGQAVRIGWIGEAGDRASLLAMLPTLEGHPGPFRLIVAGAGARDLATDHEWLSLDDPAELAERIDIALLTWRAEDRLSWTGRYFWQCCARDGVPVITGNHPALVAWIAETGAGYTAEDETTWLLALRKLLGNPELCHRLGERGRAWHALDGGLARASASLLRLVDLLGTEPCDGGGL